VDCDVVVGGEVSGDETMPPPQALDEVDELLELEAHVRQVEVLVDSAAVVEIDFSSAPMGTTKKGFAAASSPMTASLPRGSTRAPHR